MTINPNKIKLLLGAAIHKALSMRPDKDPLKDPQAGEKLWIRAAGPMVDYLYNTAGNTDLTLQQVTDNGNTTTNTIIVGASGSRFYNLAITFGSLEMFNHKIIHLAAPTNDYDAATKNYVDTVSGSIGQDLNNHVLNLYGYVDQNFEAMKEPTGFPNLTDSSFNFRDDTRVFEIEETGTDFDYYIHGTKYTISGSHIEIPDTEGVHYIYLNSSKQLVSTQTFSSAIFTDNAWVANIYWDATNSAANYLGEERHGITMDSQTHLYLHQTEGTRYGSGLALNTFDADGSGNDETNAQFGHTAGVVWDEDLKIEIAADIAPAQIPVFYKLGIAGNWRRTTATDYPLVHGADYAGTRAAWNELDGSEWKLTEVGNNNFMLTHYFATNDVNYPVIGVCGQAEYSNLAAARAGAIIQLNSIIITGLPFKEFKAIATVIFQTADAYSNTPKSRVRTSDTGDDWIDWRFSAGTSSAGTQINDHSQLTGLTHDDHLQYYNAERLAGVVSGSNHPTSSTLDDVCGNGNTTTQPIISTTSGSWLKDTAINGELTVYDEHFRVLGGDIITNWDVFANSAIVNYGFKNIEAQVIFRKPTSGYEILQWDHNNNYFNFTDTLNVDGDLQVDGNIYVNYNGPDGDSFVYFYESSSPTGASLKFADGANRFEMNHGLALTGGLDTTESIICTTTTGNIRISTTAAKMGEFKSTNATSSDIRILNTGTGNAIIYFDGSNGDLAGGDYASIGQINSSLDFQFNLEASAGTFKMNKALEITGEMRSDSIRLDQTPTAEVNTATHYVTIDFNGTSYKVLLKSI